MRHFTVIADLNVAQKKNLAWWLIFIFFAYFIPVYAIVIIVKNCVFAMDLYFRQYIFNYKLLFVIQTHKNVLVFLFKTSVVRFFYFFYYSISWPTYAVFSEFVNWFSLAWYSTLTRWDLFTSKYTTFDFSCMVEIEVDNVYN